MNDICCQYNLPNPLLLLKNPPSQEDFKAGVKLKVLDYWKRKHRSDAAQLGKASFVFFKPIYMSLRQPHLLWTTCCGNSYELNKASIQAEFLLGCF